MGEVSDHNIAERVRAEPTLPIARLEDLLRKATPRPWSIGVPCEASHLDVPIIGGSFWLAFINRFAEPPIGRVKANADLIVETINALPDLLAALKRRGDALDVAEKALERIAKYTPAGIVDLPTNIAREALARIRSGGKETE